MIVLDTSVISEPMRASPEINVVDWLNTQSPAGLFTTSVSILELRFWCCTTSRRQAQSRAMGGAGFYFVPLGRRARSR